MKIYKVAQGTPPGSVKIEVTIDDNGNFDRRILEHGAGTSCVLEDDGKLLDDYLSELGEIGDTGHTSEHFEAIRGKENQVVQKPQLQGPFSGGPKLTAPKEKKTEMGLGYGV